MQIGHRPVELVEQRSDAGEIAAAGFGHRDAPRPSPEQRDTQPVLEDLDQAPHGIGRNAEFGARRVEASQARRCFEGAERVERRQPPVIASPQFSWGWSRANSIYPRQDMGSRFVSILDCLMIFEPFLDLDQNSAVVWRFGRALDSRAVGFSAGANRGDEKCGGWANPSGCADRLHGARPLSAWLPSLNR